LLQCPGGNARRRNGFFTLRFRPDRDNWKLASHNVAGFSRKNEICPERTIGNVRLPSSLRDKYILPSKTQPLRSWLICFAASRLCDQFTVNWPAGEPFCN
jgi:hypothetical protein